MCREDSHTIEVSLMASLQKYGPADGKITVKHNQTVRDLIEILGLRDGMVQMAFVDGRFTDLDSPLDDVKKVLLLPAVGGG